MTLLYVVLASQNISILYVASNIALRTLPHLTGALFFIHEDEWLSGLFVQFLGII